MNLLDPERNFFGVLSDEDGMMKEFGRGIGNGKMGW